MTGTLTHPNPPSLPSPRRRSSKRLWLVFAVLMAAFVFLLVEGLGSSLNFFDTVDQALANAPDRRGDFYGVPAVLD